MKATLVWAPNETRGRKIHIVPPVKESDEKWSEYKYYPHEREVVWCGAHMANWEFPHSYDTHHFHNEVDAPENDFCARCLARYQAWKAKNGYGD